MKIFRWLAMLLLIALVAAPAVFAASESDVDTIVVMGSGHFDPSTPAGSYMQEIGRLYESLNPGVKIEFHWGSWGDLWKKVGVMLGNRQGPDIVVGSREYLFAPGRGGGQWEDILLVPEEYWLSEVEQRAAGPAIVEASRFPGRDGYMVWPWFVYIDKTMVVNGDMLREVGYDPVEIQQNGWTVEEFLDIAKKVTEKGYHAAYFGPMGGHNGERIWQIGVDSHRIPLRLMGQFIDIKTGEFFLDEEGLLKGWSLIQQMVYEDGTIPPSSVGVAFDESREAFVNGKTAFSFDGPDLITLIEERNRAIAAGRVQGEPFEAYVVPRPHFSDRGYGPIRPEIISQGFYHFKQEPYKGDEHSENVWKFAKFMTSPVFQATLAHNNFIPPDARVWAGEQSWFPGILGSGPNAEMLAKIRQDALPKMGVYVQMVVADDLWQDLNKFRNEVFNTVRDSVSLGEMTPEEGVAKLRAELDKLAAKYPKDQRLKPNAAEIAAELDAFARSVGMPY